MDRRLTLEQMAFKLNRCSKTFRKYVATYEIPHIRLGRDLLFDEAEVIRHLKARSTNTKIKLERKSVQKPKPSGNERYAKLLNL
jgi:hypothetical protein